MGDSSSTEEVRGKILAILRRDLRLGPDVRLDDETPFLNSEADLDSLDVLLLVASVEKTFGIKIANEEVGQTAFQSLGALTRFVSTQLAGNGVAAKTPDPLKLLPHGEPFRFVSRLTKLEPGSAGEGVWTISGNEAFFAGHFPGRPVVPGVLIGEALAQLSGIVGANPAVQQQEGALAHLDLRFDRPVSPPAEIILKSKFSRQLGQLQQFEVAAESAGITVARGTLALHRSDVRGTEKP